MTTRLIVLMTAFISACGGAYTHEVSGEVNVKFDFSQLTSYFRYLCAKDLGPHATEAQMTQCVNEHLNEFVNVTTGLF
jgi:hypothetical protein